MTTQVFAPAGHPRGRFVSHMNWHDILPKHVAIAQIGWERRRQAIRLRELGLTLRQIGNRLGVGPERARHFLAIGQRRSSEASPVEQWMAQDQLTEVKSFIKRLPKGRVKEFASRPALIARSGRR